MVFSAHEGIGILPDRIANRRMVLQVGLQRGMVLYELPIIDERRIFPELLGSFTMAIEEAIETCQFRAVGVAVAIVFAAVETVFSAHEGIGILPDRIANCRMVLQVGLQRGMVLYELPIIDERRIFPELLGSFTMAIEEAIETCQFRAVGVAVAIVFAAVETVFSAHEGIGILPDRIANRRMVLQVGLQRGMVLYELPIIDERRSVGE